MTRYELQCVTFIIFFYSRLIDLAGDISNVREQDYFTLLANISNNRIGEPIVWDFYRNEWKYLVDRFSLNDRLLGRVSNLNVF